MNRLRILIAFLIVIGITIVFHFLSWLAPIERTIRSIIRPLASSAYSFSVSLENEIQVFDDPKELEKAYIELISQKNVCTVDTATVALLTAENETLKQQLKFVRERELSHVGARVIGKGIDPLEQTIVLDRGETSGVSVGDAVIVGNGILIGQIIRVEEGTSLVRLLEDSQSRMGVTFAGNETTIGVLEGGFGISLHINFIPQNEIVEVGQTVVTSGIVGIPKGLVVGTVEAVERQPYEPFQRAIVTPLSQYDSLSAVSVLIQM